MDPAKLLKGKKILIVDDEPDVLELLIDLLEMCKIDTASSFEEGKKQLESETYDVAILDIMGVKGFELLKIANQNKIPSLMLTAHGLSEANLKKSAEEGAYYYAPKEKMDEIELFVADVLEASEKKKSPWAKWFDRLSSFYDSKFHGPNWREQEQEFWEEKIKRQPEV
jgi:DNA-binding response OmpR family regulator